MKYILTYKFNRIPCHEIERKLFYYEMLSRFNIHVVFKMNKYNPNVTIQNPSKRIIFFDHPTFSRCKFKGFLLSFSMKPQQCNWP